MGLNIGLPFEQRPNPYITPELTFEFHYFFMRKFWFAYLAKALVVFPGGFGTMDEMIEILTLVQTAEAGKEDRDPAIRQRAYWKEMINFDAMVRHGMISERDLNLFRYADEPKPALTTLKLFLTANYLQPEQVRHADDLPDIAQSRDLRRPRSGVRSDNLKRNGARRLARLAEHVGWAERVLAVLLAWR